MQQDKETGDSATNVNIHQDPIKTKSDDSDDVEPPLKKTTTWCIKYVPSATAKRKTPSTKIARECRAICLTCYLDKKDPPVFLLCRQDVSTKERHVKRKHKGCTLNQILILPYDSNEKHMHEARQAVTCFKNDENKPVTSRPPTTSRPILSTESLNVTKDKTENTQPPSTAGFDILSKCDSELPIPVPKCDSDLDLIKNDDEKYQNKEQPDLFRIEAKIDDLSVLVKNLSINVRSDKNAPKPTQGPIQLIDSSQQPTPEWKNINNIIELANQIPHIRFYAGNSVESIPSVIRCEVCHDLIISRYPCQVKDDPRKVALSGIGRYSGCLSSGLLITPDATEKLLKGGNSYWYSMKKQIKQHLSCCGDYSQLHFDALQHYYSERKKENRGVKVTENLIKIALNVIKTKSANCHFESMIASHISTGSDLGDFGHSRNHFNEILEVMNVWLNEQTSKYLSQPLPSTGFPPHFYVSADKSTPNRMSNQGIMICPMAEGKRIAIPVDSPLVYVSDEGSSFGSVSGAKAKELADQIFKSLMDSYESIDLRYWQGTSCDGQYQAREFHETICKIQEVDSESVFSEVIWDPSHWLNLGLLDIRDDKIGSSGKFLQCLVNRCKNIHCMFQRGKMLSCAIALAQSNNSKLKLTRGSCSTRFWTSQYREFETVIHSYNIYVEAFRNFGYNEIKSYQILGTDFVIDLCMVVDVMAPVIDLMIAVQDLSLPVWKICVYVPRVIAFLESLGSINILEPPPCLRNLVQNIEDIVKKNKFKGQELTIGWLVESSDNNIQNWKARDVDDCQSDFQTFVSSVKLSLENRYQRCVSQLSHHLTCFDFESVIELLCGERSNGKVLVDEIKLEEFGSDAFKSFVSYVCGLSHINDSIGDGYLDLNPKLAHVALRHFKQTLKNIIWDEKAIMSEWFLALL